MKNYLIINKAISELAKQTNSSMFVLWIDLLISRFIYKLSVREYVNNAYRINRIFRKNMMSSRKDKEINKLFNDQNFIHILENKVQFLKTFSKYINRSWIYPKEESLDKFINFIRQNPIIISKPIAALQGQGVMKIDTTRYNEQDISDLYLLAIKDNLLLETYIKQHHDMYFNNASVNTIRVFSVQDDRGKIHILKTVLRVGKGNSVVDNFCAGGVVYPIDKETGIIEGKGIDMKGNKYIYHVGSEIQMVGRQIPYWSEVRRVVVSAAASIKEVRYIGWDIVITESGVDIIEANHNPDTDFLEYIGSENCFYPQILKYK